MIKRERVGSKVLDHQYMFLKVRHEQKKNDKVVVPFSVYLRFLKPKELAGREVGILQQAHRLRYRTRSQARLHLRRDGDANAPRA